MWSAKDDEADLIAIRRLCEGMCGHLVPCWHWSTDQLIVTGPAGARRVADADPKALGEGEAVHRPDACACLADGKVMYIVELDGSLHDRGPGRKRTERRDRDYREAGVPFAVLNKADIAQLGTTWQEVLGSALAAFLRRRP